MPDPRKIIQLATSVPKMLEELMGSGRASKLAAKIAEPSRTQVLPMPNRWFLQPDKYPKQQPLVERVLQANNMERIDFFSGANVDPKTGKVLDFNVMDDLGVAITNRPSMSGVPSGMESFLEVPESTGPLTKSNLVRRGLFKPVGGDPMLNDLSFLATIERSGAGHQYGLGTEYLSPAELTNTMTGANPTLRPHSRGDLFGMGDVVGRIQTPQGRPTDVYESLLVAPKGSDVKGVKLHKKKGGAVDQTIAQAKSKQTGQYNPQRVRTPSQFERDFDQYRANISGSRGVLDNVPERLARSLVGAPAAVAGYAAQIPGMVGDLREFYDEIKPDSYPNAPDWLKRTLTTDQIQELFLPENASPELRAGLAGGNAAAIAEGVASLPGMVKGAANLAASGAKKLAPTAAKFAEDYLMRTGQILPAVKLGGGNWSSRGVDDALRPLKKDSYALTPAQVIAARHERLGGIGLADAKSAAGLNTYGEPLSRRELLGEMSTMRDYKGTHRERLEQLLLLPHELSVDTWVDKQMRKYLTDTLSTPNDPLIKLADAWPAQQTKLLEAKQAQLDKAVAARDKLQIERNVAPEVLTRSNARIRELETEKRLIKYRKGLHGGEFEEYVNANPFEELTPADMFDTNLAGRRADAGMPAEGFGKTPMGKAWENATDEAIISTRAGKAAALRWFPDDTKWIKKLPRDTPIYNFNPNSTGTPLGFSHLVDEIRNAVSPDSTLPAQFRIDAKDLSKWTVPQMSEHVDKINAWRKVQSEDAINASREGIPVHKEYPEGYQWLAVPDLQTNPEALKYATEVGCQGGWCTEGADTATRYGSGNNRLYVLHNPSGNAVAQISTKPNLVDPVAAKYAKVPLSIREEIRADAMARNPHVDKRLWGPIKPGVLSDAEAMRDSQIREATRRRFPELAELEKLKRIAEIKGLQNEMPKPEDLPYVQDFVRSGKWSDVGDLQNTGLIKTHKGIGGWHDISPEMSGNARQLAYGRASAAGEIQPYMTKVEIEAAMKKHAQDNNILPPSKPMTEADITGPWEPEGMKRGGPVSQDAMQMAVWNKAIRKQVGGAPTQAEIDAAQRAAFGVYPKQPATPSSSETKKAVADASKLIADLVIPQTPVDLGLMLLGGAGGKVLGKLGAGIVAAGSSDDVEASNLGALMRLLRAESPMQMQQIRKALGQAFTTGNEHSVVGPTHSIANEPRRVGRITTQGKDFAVAPDQFDVTAAVKSKSPIMDFHSHPNDRRHAFAVAPSSQDFHFAENQYFPGRQSRELKTLIASPADAELKTPTSYSFFATDNPSKAFDRRAYEAAVYELQRSGKKIFKDVIDNPEFKDYFESGGHIGNWAEDVSPLALLKLRELQGLGRGKLQLSGAPVTASGATNIELYKMMQPAATEFLRTKKFDKGGIVGGEPTQAEIDAATLPARMNPNLAAQGDAYRANMAAPTSIMDPRYPAWKKNQDAADAVGAVGDLALSAIPLVGPAARGVMSASKALTPTAAKFAEDYMLRTGMQLYAKPVDLSRRGFFGLPKASTSTENALVPTNTSIKSAPIASELTSISPLEYLIQKIANAPTLRRDFLEQVAKTTASQALKGTLPNVVQRTLKDIGVHEVAKADLAALEGYSRVRNHIDDAVEEGSFFPANWSSDEIIREVIKDPELFGIANASPSLLNKIAGLIETHGFENAAITTALPKMNTRLVEPELRPGTVFVTPDATKDVLAAMWERELKQNALVPTNTSITSAPIASELTSISPLDYLTQKIADTPMSRRDFLEQVAKTTASQALKGTQRLTNLPIVKPQTAVKPQTVIDLPQKLVTAPKILSIGNIAKAYGFKKQRSGVDRGSYTHPETGETISVLRKQEFGHSRKDGSTISSFEPKDFLEEHLENRGYTKDTGYTKPEQQRRGGLVNQDAMQMAVWNKQLRKQHG